MQIHTSVFNIVVIMEHKTESQMVTIVTVTMRYLGYNRLGKKNILKKTDKKLVALAGSKIVPMGVCNLECVLPSSEKKYLINFIVADIASQPILGLHTSMILGLIHRM
jgi:hypothetical protein